MCPPHRPPPPRPHPPPAYLPSSRLGVGLPLVLSLSALLLPHKAEGAPAPAPLVAALRAGIVLTTAACAALFTDSCIRSLHEPRRVLGDLAADDDPSAALLRADLRAAGGALRTSLAVGMACAGALVAAASVAAVVGDLARGQGASPEGAARL
eukprot:tig00020629_g12374.t1